MKKSFIYLFAMLAAVMLTACGSDDKPINKQTVTMTINSRAIEGDNIVFSQGSAKVEFDYTNMFIMFTSEYKDVDGQSHTITTPEMKLYPSGGMIYSFNNMASNTYTGIDALTGYIDLSSGMMWYSFESSNCLVYCTTQLLYAYTTTTITNPENDNIFNHEQSAYLFALDTRGEKCVMKISNFIPNTNGTVQASEILYDGLTVTPTTTGYKITAAQVESSYRGYYTITDLNITLNSQCQIIGGSFKCGGLEHTLSGRLFPSQSSQSTPI